MIRDEIRERFVRAILEQVPADRVSEIHFFAPIRQAGIESGVAVLAVEPAANADDLAAAAPPANPVARYTVYTARYRLTLKGPDRGKWETSVVAEAEAPLVTVEAVVSGVRRRSGDTEDPERVTGDWLHAALGPAHDAS